MTRELDVKLCEKYPEIFADRRGDMHSTAMCWGFEHGDGWYDILDTLCSLIMWHCTQNLHNKPEGKPLPIPRATQVKEKFGTLRFYTGPCDDTVKNYIEFAHEHSARVCEECGAPGKQRGVAWIYTLCDSCTAKKDPDLLVDDSNDE